MPLQYFKRGSMHRNGFYRCSFRDVNDIPAEPCICETQALRGGGLPPSHVRLDEIAGNQLDLRNHAPPPHLPFPLSHCDPTAVGRARKIQKTVAHLTGARCSVS